MENQTQQAFQSDSVGPTIIKPDKTYKLPLLVLAILFIAVSAVAGYFFYQTMRFSSEIASLKSQISKFDSEIEALEGELSDEHIQYSELEGAVNGYLRNQKIKCNDDLLPCLNTLVKKTSTTSSQIATKSSTLAN